MTRTNVVYNDADKTTIGAPIYSRKFHSYAEGLKYLVNTADRMEAGEQITHTSGPTTAGYRQLRRILSTQVQDDTPSPSPSSH